MREYVLLLPILLPVLTGAGLLLRPIRRDRARDLFVEAAVLLTTGVTLWLILWGPRGTLYLFSLSEKLPLTLRIDGLAAFFGALVAVLWPLATLYAFEYMRHEDRRNTFFAFYTMTYGVTLGVAFAGNIFSMYLFYETLTMVTLPLVMHTMTPAAKKATRKYLYYMIGGTAFAFIAMVFYVLYAGGIEFAYGGTLDLDKIAHHDNVVYLIYLMGFFGFGVKAAVFPFHSWLPEASVAPTPVTALLHAVAVVKAGIFAVIRFTWYCVGPDVLAGSWAQTVALLFAMATVVYASTMGVREPHFKRRLAYSTVSNLSYILLGVMTLTPAGLLAGLTHMLFHAVMKIGGFFGVGAVMHQTGREYVYELDGLGRRMPWTFAHLLISGLSLAGLPLFSGFVSKFLIAGSLFLRGGPLGYAGVLALLYSALMTAIYMLTAVVRGFFPERDTDQAALAGYTDPNWRMLVPLGIFSAVTVAFGVWAGPVVDALRQVALGIF